MAQTLLFPRCEVRHIAAWLAGATVLLLWAPTADATVVDSAKSQKDVAQDIEMIYEGERSGMAPLKLGRLWAHLASDYEDAMEIVKSEDAYNHALRLMEGVVEARLDYAIVLDNLGSMYVMSGDLIEAERCRMRSLAARVEMGDRLEIARGRAHLAEVQLGRHRFKEAEEESRAAFDEMLAVKDTDAGDLVSTMVTLIYAECVHDGCAQGLVDAHKASALAVGAFGANSIPVGQTHLALGYAEWKAGVKDGPDAEMRTGIELMKEQTGPGHPYVLSALEQYKAGQLEETGPAVASPQPAQPGAAAPAPAAGNP